LSFAYTGIYPVFKFCMNRKTTGDFASEANKQIEHVLSKALKFHQQGLLDDAKKAYLSIISKAPTHWETLNLLGQIYRVEKNFPMAVEVTSQAIGLQPTSPELFLNLGLIMHEMGQFEAALECYGQAISIRANYAKAWSNKAISESSLRRLDESVRSLQHAIEIEPANADFHSNLGNTYSEMGLQALSIQSHDRALALNKKVSDLWMSKSKALSMFQHYEEAMHCQQSAIELQPANPNLLWTHSHNCLMRGDFQTGWRLHEYRWLAPKSGLKRRPLRSKPWIGEESLQQKRILLYSEQGLGDCLQFCRFTPWVISLGARVTLLVPKPLLRLTREMGWGCDVIGPDELIDDHDFHCPLMSLPLAFGFDLSHIPQPYPYISAHQSISRQWAEKLGTPTKPRVGLVWSGGTHQGQPELVAINERRNIAFEKLSALASVDVEFHSLQKGAEAEQELQDSQDRDWNAKRVIDWASELNDFSETAGLIEQLDLVIAVDTSTAHLSAAMGKPTWLLNRYDSCWRWLIDRSDSAWYPSMRIFRQQGFNDWSHVIAQLSNELTDFKNRWWQNRKSD